MAYKDSADVLEKEGIMAEREYTPKSESKSDSQTAKNRENLLEKLQREDEAYAKERQKAVNEQEDLPKLAERAEKLKQRMLDANAIVQANPDDENIEYLREIRASRAGQFRIVADQIKNSLDKDLKEV